MMGSTEKQITFSDCWLEGKIPDNSYWSKMRKWALENLDEKMFQPLFSYYGRPSVSPIYTFTGILVQLEKGIPTGNLKENPDLMIELNMQ